MSDKTENLIERAEHLVEIDRYKDAIPMLGKALAADPGDYHANCLLALCYYHLENYLKAQEYAEKAIESDPDEEWGHRLRSVALSGQGRNREALASAEEAARLNPDQPLVLTTLVGALLTMKNHKRAQEIAEQLVEIAPYMETSHFTLGNVHLHHGRNWEAEKSYREALRINPESSDVRNNLGVAMLRQDNGQSGSIFNASKLSILEREKNEEVEEHFREALRLAPDNALAAENLRRQYTYVYPIAIPVAIIPFTMMALFIMPLGAIITFVLTLWHSGKMASEVRRKRAELPPEFKHFLGTGTVLGEGSPIERFSTAIWTLFEKSWKPHLLALAAVVVAASDVRLLAWMMMFASFFWLAHELKKEE